MSCRPTSLPKKMWDIAHCIRSRQVDFSPTRLRTSRRSVSLCTTLPKKSLQNSHQTFTSTLTNSFKFVSCTTSLCKFVQGISLQNAHRLALRGCRMLATLLKIIAAPRHQGRQKRCLERFLNMVQQRCGNGGAWATGM